MLNVCLKWAVFQIYIFRLISSVNCISTYEIKKLHNKKNKLVTSGWYSMGAAAANFDTAGFQNSDPNQMQDFKGMDGRSTNTSNALCRTC